MWWIIDLLPVCLRAAAWSGAEQPNLADRYIEHPEGSYLYQILWCHHLATTYQLAKTTFLIIIMHAQYLTIPSCHFDFTTITPDWKLELHLWRRRQTASWNDLSYYFTGDSPMPLRLRSPWTRTSPVWRRPQCWSCHRRCWVCRFQAVRAGYRAGAADGNAGRACARRSNASVERVRWVTAGWVPAWLWGCLENHVNHSMNQSGTVTGSRVSLRALRLKDPQQHESLGHRLCEHDFLCKSLWDSSRPQKHN